MNTLIPRTSPLVSLLPLLSLAALLLGLSACDNPSAQREGRLIIGEDACETDADCVPVSCCHADACVAATRAPICDGVFCTKECRPDTLDCGGSCLCHEGRCAAQLWEPTPTPDAGSAVSAPTSWSSVESEDLSGALGQ